MSAIAPGMILIAYLCGSISSAILVCRLCGLPDPRTSGSGNPGATNVLRIGGKGAAVAVLIFDVLKGMLPVWGAYELGVSPFWLGLIAIAACLGHIWPVFFGFTDRAIERILVAGSDCQCTDCSVLCLVV